MIKVAIMTMTLVMIMMVGMEIQCDAIASCQAKCRLGRTEEWASCAGSAFNRLPSNPC